MQPHMSESVYLYISNPKEMICFSPTYEEHENQACLDIAIKGVKAHSPKDLRIMVALQQIMNGKDL